MANSVPVRFYGVKRVDDNIYLISVRVMACRVRHEGIPNKHCANHMKNTTATVMLALVRPIIAHVIRVCVLPNSVRC